MTLRVLFFTVLFAARLAMAQGTGLSPENKRFGDLLQEVRKLASQQQFDQALVKLGDAEKIKPGSPIVLNARGSIYTNMKDYAKARESFKQAERMYPGSFEPHFNLTEHDFVEGRYDAAAASFTKLLAAQPDLQEPIRALMQFKIVLCHIKLGKIPEAEELTRRFSFPDESPASYFTKMAFAAHDGRNAQAGELLDKAQKTFGGVPIAPYLDAMVEAKWITLRRDPRTKK